LAELIDAGPLDLHRPGLPGAIRKARRPLVPVDLDGDPLGLETVQSDPAGEERQKVDLPAAPLGPDLGGEAPAGGPQPETRRLDVTQ
jgi:hypothetical protein